MTADYILPGCQEYALPSDALIFENVFCDVVECFATLITRWREELGNKWKIKANTKCYLTKKHRLKAR